MGLRRPPKLKLPEPTFVGLLRELAKLGLKRKGVSSLLGRGGCYLSDKLKSGGDIEWREYMALEELLRRMKKAAVVCHAISASRSKRGMLSRQRSATCGRWPSRGA